MKANMIATSGWIRSEMSVFDMRPLTQSEFDELCSDMRQMDQVEFEGSCTVFMCGTDIGYGDESPFLKKVFVRKEA